MKICIYGGSFNPPHIGHLRLAQAAYEGGALDRVIFIPCGNPPHKDGSDFADAEDRLEMTRLLTDGDARFSVCDIEIKSADKSYTATTLEKLRAMHPDWELCFIVGEDSLRDMKDWHMPKRIFTRAEIIAAVRGGLDHSNFMRCAELYRQKYGAVIRTVEMTETDVSASRIRQLIKNGGDARYMLTDKVAEYIKEKGIYREI